VVAGYRQIHMIKHLAFAIGLTALVVSSPAALAATSKKPAKTTTTPATVTILTVGRFGGFVPQGYDQRSNEEHIVRSDGQHYSPGPVPSIYPGPALSPVLVDQLTKPQLAELDRRAKAAGLDRPSTDWGIPNTADVPNLVITYRGRVHSIPSFGVGEGSLSKQQRAARASVKTVLDLLVVSPKATLYKPTAVVLTAQGVQPGDNDPSAPAPTVVDWPKGAPVLGNGGSCQLIGGESGKVVAALLSAQNELTQYRSENFTYRVFARISVPGDRGCK
jgi:hypothetical protein